MKYYTKPLILMSYLLTEYKKDKMRKRNGKKYLPNIAKLNNF